MKKLEEKLIHRIKESEGEELIKAKLSYSNYLRQNDPHKSYEIAAEALKQAEEGGNENIAVLALIHQAYARFYSSDYQSALELTNVIIQRGMKTNNSNQLGTAHNIKARIAFKSDNPARALELNLKALEYYLKDPLSVNLMSCYNNLGMCHLHMSNTKEAKHYYNLALEEAEKISHPAKDVILMNLGNIYYNEEDYQTAMKSYQKAAKLFKEKGMTVNYGNVCHNLGLVCFRLNQREKALDYYEQAQKIYREFKDYKELSYVLNSIGLDYIRNDKLEEGYSYLKESLQVAEEHNLKWNINICYKSFTLYWEKKQDYKKKSEYLEKMIKLGNDLNEEINREKLTEMETRYKTKIYKLQKQELTERNRVMSEQIGHLNTSLQEQRELYTKLEKEFRKTAGKLNERDDLLSSQARMATMGEMISMIAHQWKQPLNVIGVLVQSFQDAWEFDELNEEFINQQVEVVMKQVYFLASTIDEFRDFFKPETERVFQVQNAVHRALHLLEYVLHKTDVEIELDLADDCRLKGVINDFAHVLINIINNAREAMLDEEVEKPYISIKSECSSDELNLKIFNRGSRLSDTVKGKLFEPYFTTKGEKGTGIGLYICQMIIENKFNGIITAENVRDGVEFEIKIKNFR